jgi:hypothetical protein
MGGQQPHRRLIGGQRLAIGRQRQPEQRLDPFLGRGQVDPGQRLAGRKVQAILPPGATTGTIGVGPASLMVMTFSTAIFSVSTTTSLSGRAGARM